MPTQHVQEHIELIARQEQEFFERRTTAERAGDSIAAFAGSLRFVAIHLLIFGTWIVWNAAPGLRAHRFDPPPFSLLSTIVAMEAILLASFILMRQQRTSRRADEREHLMLQVLLLTEKETTALLQVNREMAQLLGLQHVARDANIAALSEETPIDEVAEHIKETLPTESDA
jgi:uncharacterized membrane protein